MGNRPPTRDPSTLYVSITVPAGKTRICVAAYNISHNSGRAHYLASKIAELHPDQYETWFYFDSPGAYDEFLVKKFDPVPFPEHLKGHSSSPFIWLESGADAKIQPLGGRSHFAEWAREKFADESEIVMMCTEPSLGDACHNGCGACCFCFACCCAHGPMQTSRA